MDSTIGPRETEREREREKEILYGRIKIQLNKLIGTPSHL